MHMLGDSPSSTIRRTLRARTVTEAKRFVIIFLYLWALCGLFVLHERIVLHERGIGYTFHGVAILNAFILAKVTLVFEDLDLARWLPDQRAIYRVCSEAFLLTILFIAFHFVERGVMAAIKGEQASSVQASGGGIGGLLSVAAI